MRRLLMVVAICIAPAIAAAGQEAVTTFATFNDNTGITPQSPLIQGKDGNFYGTVALGGPNYQGTVFKITLAGVITVLYSFCQQSSCADGAQPAAGLIKASDGNFYGTTYSGGYNHGNCNHNCGTIFRITPAGTLTTLYQFHEWDGKNPSAALVQASDGNLYGTAAWGGAHSWGTLFKISLQGEFSLLYSFCSLGQELCSDGTNPRTALVQGLDGSLYGTTPTAGPNGAGTIFKITLQGTLTTLYGFSGANSDGVAPTGLVLASDGNFYGAVDLNPPNLGKLFRITPGGTLTTVRTFTSQDGTSPDGTLVQGSDGNLYGPGTGGLEGGGTLLKITLSGKPTVLHNFNNWDGTGANPGQLVQATDGNFYGIASPIAFRLLGKSYHLAVTRTGQGTVTSGDGFINCGLVCYDQYEAGASLTLTATPALNWVFGSWSGCDSTQDNVCTVKMDKDKTVVPTFIPIYGLIISKVGGGTVTSADGYINCGSACSHGYLSGTPVTLTGTPDKGMAFANWGSCDSTHENTCWLNMSGGRDVWAYFSPGYVLTAAKSGNGLITSTDGDINCGATCTYSYVPGRSVTLTAYADPDYTFFAWSGCDKVTANICTVSMFVSRTATAIFTPPHPLNVAYTGNGSITSSDGYINCGSSCSHTYRDGIVVNLTAAPGQGWGFASWSGCDQTRANACLVTMNADRAVGATFKLLYPLSVSKSGEGTVSSTDGHIYCGNFCSYSYVDGTPVTLSALPSSGTTFTGWTGCDNANGSYCSVTVAGAKNVAATFTATNIILTSLTFKPTYVKGGHLSAGTLTLSGSAPPGGVTVALSSDHPSVAHPPSFVFVPGGKSSTQFAVQTFPVKSNITVTITATAGSSQVSGGLMVGTTSLPPSLR